MAWPETWRAGTADLEASGAVEQRHGSMGVIRGLFGLQRVRALLSEKARHERRERRAVFRPADSAALDAGLLPFVDTIVGVRRVGIADTQSPFAGQCLYRIVAEGHVTHRLYPQCQFDFLD